MNRLPLGGPALALTAALAVLLIILIAFPADIFNKTYEACRREIHGLLRVRLLRKVLDAPAWFQGLLLVLTAAALWFLFSRHEGPATVKGSVGNGNLIAQTLALTVAIPLVMAVYTAPGEFYLRRVRTAVLRVPPVALAVAVLCGVVSYRLKLEPAYAFGLFAMFVPRHDAPKAKESTRARGVLFSSLTLGALVLVGYYGFTVNFAPAHSGAAGWTSVLLDAICYWVVVLGAECLIFTLLPMHFLDGRTLAGWSLWLWTFLQFGAACFFWQVLQGKAAADPTKITDPSVAKALLFFVIFGVLSLAFWKYFRWPNRPSKKHGDPDAPPLADLFRPAAAYRRYRDEAVLGWNWLNRVTRLGSGRIVRATRRAAGTLRTAAWHASTETRYAAALARYYLRATLRSVAERLRPPRPE